MYAHTYTHAYIQISTDIILICDVVDILETQCNVELMKIETYDYMNAHKFLLLRLMV